MILIGKTADCLLGAYVIAHSAVLKAVDEFVRMREITRFVKVALKCLIAVVLVDDDLPYWTSKVVHLVAFTAIFSNICTAHAQKRLFMNFRCKFRHRRSIRRPRFPIKVQNFSDLATLSVDLCILYAECRHISTFYFLSVLENFTSYNVSDWLPLKMRTRPLRMRRTWPVSRGWKTITFLESQTPICLFTIQLRWLYDEYN